MSGLNVDFDSRIIRVSSGPGGVTRPEYSPDGSLERVYCLHCGKPGGFVTAELPPALWHDPGVIYVCPDCDAKFGPLPAHAISFDHRKG